jgi:PAS domain S-box-containing protein
MGGPPTDVRSLLERIDVPSGSVDTQQRVTWLNAAARDILGDIVGRAFLDHVAPEARQLATEAFTAKALGVGGTHRDSTLIDKKGRRVPVEISSVPMRDGGAFLGVFGLVTPPGKLEPKPPPALEPRLTPRQYEVLRLLGRGASTDQIAAALGIRRETARNHIRAVMKQLRQPSRLAAVAYGRQHGLL